MDKFRLIAEIRQRPILWNSQLKETSKSRDIADSWKEVARSLGDKVTVRDCQSTFKYLQNSHRMGKNQIQNRIDRDKYNGTFDPKKDYNNYWVYNEAMDFFYENSEKPVQPLSKSDSDVVTVKKQVKRRESRNQRDIRSNRKSFSSSHSSTTGTNIIDDSEEEQRKVPHVRQYHNTKRRSLLKKFYTTEQNSSVKTNEELLNQNFSQNEDDYIPSYSSEPKSAYYQINFMEETDAEEPSSQLNQIPNADIKEEPPLDIEADSYHLVEEESQENEIESLKPQSPDKNSTLKQNEILSHKLQSPDKKSPLEQNPQSPDKNSTLKQNKILSPKLQSPDKNSMLEQNCPIIYSSKTNENLSLPWKKNNIQLSWSSIQDIDDSDLNFLTSFLSHMKSLTALQNLQFRAKMSNLILSFLTSTCSAKEFTTPECNTNKLPMDISDPDCNFLISFWPYMKSLTQIQNLHYRAKMSHLLIDILSKDDIKH